MSSVPVQYQFSISSGKWCNERVAFARLAKGSSVAPSNRFREVVYERVIIREGRLRVGEGQQRRSQVLALLEEGGELLDGRLDG